MRPSASMRSRKGLRVTLSMLSLCSLRARSLSRALLSAALAGGGAHARRDGAKTGAGVVYCYSRVFAHRKKYPQKPLGPPLLVLQGLYRALRYAKTGKIGREDGRIFGFFRRSGLG
jgi:hypothetical protein